MYIKMCILSYFVLIFREMRSIMEEIRIENKVYEIKTIYSKIILI